MLVTRGIKAEPLVMAGRGVVKLGQGVRGVAKSIGPSATVDRWLTSAFRLHPNQVKNFKNLNGELPSEFLIRKGILSGGAAEVTAEEGVKLTGKSIFGRTKDGVVRDLESIKDTAYKAVRKELGSVQETYDLLDTPQVFEAMDEVGKTATQYGLIDEQNVVKSLLQKGRANLLDANHVKELIDRLYVLYSKSNEPTASLNAERIRRIRSSLKEFIEAEAEKKNLPDVRMLNKDVQLSTELLLDIERAEMTGKGRPVGSLMDSLFAIGTYGITQNFLATAGVVVARRAFESVPFKTTFAKYLNRLSVKQLKELLGAAKNGRHTTETRSTLRKVILQTAEDLKNQVIADEELSRVLLSPAPLVSRTGRAVQETQPVLEENSQE